MKNRTLKLFIVFSSVFIIISCAEKKQDIPKPPPVAVNVYEAKKESAIYYDEFPATVTALNQVDLKAQVTGYITGSLCPIPANWAINALNKKPSVCCGIGINGCRNTGNFSSSP